ncbi:MAG: hypothetical protein V4481_04290 [Patescibacteria group bacterium]
MKRFLLPLIIIVVVIGFVWYSFFRPETGAGSSSKNILPTATDPSVATSTPIYTLDSATAKTYIDSIYHFSFRYPGDFKASPITAEGVTTILVQDSKAAAGFQIDITPMDEDIQTLTVERIKQDLPGIYMESPQDVVLGASGKGVAFFGDDPAFGGKSREVWFVYKKTLYQIRTYVRYDSLLKAVLGTWEFK